MQPHLSYGQSIAQSFNHPFPQSTVTYFSTLSTDTFSMQLGLQNLPKTSHCTNSQSNTTNIETNEQKLQFHQQTQELLDGGLQFFQEDISALYPIIYQAATSGLLSQPNIHNQLPHETIKLLVTTGKTDKGILRCNQRSAWLTEHDITDACIADQTMINYLMLRMQNCTNDTFIELAQNCLESWSQAQTAQTQPEYAMHQKTYATCYHALYNQAEFQNFAHHAQPVPGNQLEQLLDRYDLELDQQNCDYDDPYYQRLQLRSQCLAYSLDNPELTDHTFLFSPQEIGFMMAHNINYGAFQNKNCSMFQHCLSREARDIVTSIVDMHNRNNNQAYQNYLVQTCQLAVCGQQLNQQSKIEQAVAVIDLSHFFENFAKLLHGTGLSGAFYVGAGRSLDTWVYFAHQLSQHPCQTMGKVIQSYYDIACVGCKILKSVCSVTNFIQIDTIIQDLQEQLRSIESGQYTNPFDAMQQRTQQRLLRTREFVCSSIETITHATQTVVTDILEKSLYENLADAGQITTDTIITDKVSQALCYIAQFIGPKAIDICISIEEIVPPSLLDTPIQCMKSDKGQIIAVASATGENIGTLVATAGQKLIDPITKMAHAIAKAKIITDKIKEITQPNQADMKAFQKSIEPYLRMDKIINIKKLQGITDIKQIKKFQDYTNNFTNLEKLTPEEILYLNLCDWLEPQARTINATLKKKGGITLIDSQTGVSAFFEEYDLFHSLLGEMKPGSIRDHTSGGHLFIDQLRAAMLDIGEIKGIGANFFDMEIQYAGKLSDRCKPNSYFPMGTSVKKAVDMLQKTIKNHKLIECTIIENGKTSVIVIDNYNHIFNFKIENSIACFYPVNPDALKKI